MINKFHSKYYFLFGFLSPILGSILLIPQLRWTKVSWILVFFIGIFGATIVLPEQADGYRLNQMVEVHYVGLGFSQWAYELKEMILFSPEPGTKGDVFSHCWSYLIGGVLGVPQLNFFGISLIYGWLYVYVLSVVLVGYKEAPTKSMLLWAMILVFVSYQFLDKLQFIRTPMGLFALFLGVFGYYKTGKKKYVLVMMTAPLFHVAYFVMAIPAFVTIFLQKLNPKFFIFLFVASFFLNFNPTGVLNQLKTTELGESKVRGYYREDIEDWNKETGNLNWYTKYGKGWSQNKAPLVLASSLILLGFYSRKKMTKVELGLFSTGLLMATTANFGDFVPAFYNRTMTNAGIYFTATATLLAIRGELFHAQGMALGFRKFFLWVSIFAFVPYVVYVTANILNFTSIYLLFMPILGVFPELNISIREFISYVIN